MNATRKDVLEYIARDIEERVARLGIYTEVRFENSKNGLKMVSTPFRVMPAIFKKIWLEGDISFEVDKRENGDNFSVIHIGIKYCYEHYVGGSNGTELGLCSYMVQSKLPEKFGTDGLSSPKWYILRANSLPI